jgi:hypothetical protein
MSEFTAFVQLGIRHIIDVSAMDHILFLFALSAIYSFSNWREIIRVVTAFTVGHSITLAAAVLGYMPSARMVEFLIPVTIVATCVENVFVRDGHVISPWRRYRPALAAIFGLVHGAGFGGYLRSLFVDRVATPLFGFNVGIELGQIVVLALVFTVIWIMDGILATTVRPPVTLAPVRVRVLGISAIVCVFATHWALERAPW